MVPRFPDIDLIAWTIQTTGSRRTFFRGLGGTIVVACAAGTGRRGGAAQSATPIAPSAAGATPVANAVARIAVGGFEVIAVSDGSLTIPSPALPFTPAEFVFVDAPPDELAAALREAGLEAWIEDPASATYTAAITPLVVDTGQHLVLLDTGLGTGMGLPGVGQLLANLRAAGIDPAAIDTVVVSHAHVDHIMGTLGPAGLAFPNARHVMGQTEHAFWTDEARLAEVFPDPAQRDGVLGPVRAAFPVIESKLELIDDAAEAEIVPGLRAVSAYGHTPGHMAVLIGDGDDRLLAAFDALTHPLHLQYPEWNGAFDTLRDETDATRRVLLARAADEGLRLAAYHFPFPGVGTVTAEGDAWRFTAQG